MKSDNNDGFLLSIGMLFILSIFVVFVMCGKDIFNKPIMCDKLFQFIAKLIGLAFIGLIVIYGVIVAISDYTQKVSFESDDWQLESVIGTYTDYSHIIFDESVKVFDKNFGYEKVKNVIFYSKELTIKKLAFSNCKKLKQITFYANPKSIAKDAFLGCSKLSLIRFYGKKEDWEKYQIFIPSNPKIEFISTESSSNKTVEKMKVDLNCNGIINIKHR